MKSSYWYFLTCEVYYMNEAVPFWRISHVEQLGYPLTSMSQIREIAERSYGKKFKDGTHVHLTLLQEVRL